MASTVPRKAPSPVTLEGRRVRLRPLVRDDVDELWNTCGAPEAFTWLWPYRMERREDMVAFVDRALLDAEAGDRVPFAQVACETGAVVGSTSLLDVDVESSNVEIGWTLLSPTVWGSGINVEAKTLLLGYCFDELGMERVTFKTDHRNERSQAAIAALGATREGTLRHHKRRADGSWRDSVYYSILASEWPSVRERLAQRQR
ncbi:MAG: GNAT family protein [Actinomycetes bacterium]